MKRSRLNFEFHIHSIVFGDKRIAETFPWLYRQICSVYGKYAVSLDVMYLLLIIFIANYVGITGSTISVDCLRSCSFILIGKVFNFFASNAHHCKQD